MISSHNNSPKNEFIQNKGKNKLADLTTSSFSDPWLKKIQEFGKMQNMIANSTQTFDRINNLQWQVNALQQQIGYCRKYISDLLSYYLLSPKRSIEGVSGHFCKKCWTLGLKPIFNLGYDETMESRHLCNEAEDRRNYQNFQVSNNIQNLDHWTVGVFLEYMKSNTRIGQHIISKDVTKAFDDFNQVLTPEITQRINGVPDRYYSYSLKISDRIVWLNRSIENLDKEILLTQDELADFLIRVKSTYAIFEISTKEKFRRIFVFLTRN